MKSRLEAIDPSLANEIKASSLSDGKAKVGMILSKGYAALPEKVVPLLPKNFEIQSYKVSQGQIDALDSRYFDLEEKGDAEGSAAAFTAARFLAAVMSWQTAANEFGLCEAAYEANFATQQCR
ncbi:hypothetical protein [Yoonia sp. R78084]|uniref:hypothetical protein n=1 Tax=Yoonia sp. R78084 TaxID=3093869 RepID=UPI0037DD9BDB